MSPSDLTTAHHTPPLDEGVVTLVDSNFFPGFVLLYESIQNSYPVPVTCFDGGLNDTQIAWIQKHLKNCTVRPIPDTPETRQILQKLEGNSDNGTRESMLWICPFLIKDSPYQRVIWLDSDLIVVNRLGELFELLDDGPVFTLENFNPSATANHPDLYRELPISTDSNSPPPLVNGGVSGWDLNRDAEILNDYMRPALHACENHTVRRAIAWHDQGCLIWAIQNNGAHDRVLNDINWNLCARHCDRQMNYGLDLDLYRELNQAYPQANIVHWNGYPLEKKLFNKLGSETAVLNSISRRLPGPAHEKSHNRSGSPIKLISHISSATSPALISHFLKHYQTLQVDDFLIILHQVEGAGRIAESTLLKFGITPILVVGDYSATLKAQRVREIKLKYVSDNDWVVYADVDELQVYPQELRGLCDKCNRQGYQLLTGVFIDRLAQNGELKEIEADSSIWDQFPYAADVASEITGAWNRKVCAAKGGVELDYSGSHHRKYGGNNGQEYHCTYLDPACWPEQVEIHHFKWDATLRSRLENKLNGTGGDRDATDGEPFINEYYSLFSHIHENDRIAVSNSNRADETSLAPLA